MSYRTPGQVDDDIPTPIDRNPDTELSQMTRSFVHEAVRKAAVSIKRFEDFPKTCRENILSVLGPCEFTIGREHGRVLVHVVTRYGRWMDLYF